MTKIYTRTGDTGETGLYSSGRVRKDDMRMNAIGSVDELNCALGVVRAHIREVKRKEELSAASKLDYVLCRVQNELFMVGADLATVHEAARTTIPRVTGEHIVFLEKTIDAFTEGLPQLTQFILPGISLIASQLHHARAIARRAEREIIALRDAGPVGECIVPYMNRLSDTLFTLARWINKEQGCDEYLWEKS
jgi:cob(I)alamin adenosyltransferase